MEYEIVRHLGKISKNIEVNYIKYKNGVTKLDISEWTKDRKIKILKNKFSKNEIEKLKKILRNI